MALLHHFASVPGARLVLAPAMYRLVRRDEENAAHLLNEPRGEELDFHDKYFDEPECYEEAHEAWEKS